MPSPFALPVPYLPGAPGSGLGDPEEFADNVQQNFDALAGFAGRARGMVNIRDYGARGDGTTDDTTAVQAAINAVKAAGGSIYFPPGTYLITTPGLNLDDILTGVSLVGAGTTTSGSLAGSTTLTYASSSGNLISARASYGITVRGFRLLYTHASYAGNLINLDWSATARDPSYFRLADCYLGGNGASTARCLVRLNKTLLSTISRCSFNAADIHILGCDTDYSNVIGIYDNTFTGVGTVSIKNPGETWVIQGNGFEPRADGSAGALMQDIGRSCYAVSFRDNWLGDVSVNGGNWLNLNGSVLGCVIEGNRFSSPGTTTPHIVTKGGQGWAVLGNRFESGSHAIDFTGSAGSMLGIVIAGNDFQQASPLNNFTANARGDLWGNNGLDSYAYEKTVFKNPVTFHSDGVLGHINLAPTTAPTTPVDGDMWITSGGALKVQLAGVTKTVTVT